MRKQYNKLVRDRIPEIIARDGREYETVTLSEDQYREALRAKLMEEAKEVAVAEPDRLITELADVYEIMDAIMAAYQIERDLVLAEQDQRRVARGGFEKRLLLLWTE